MSDGEIPRLLIDTSSLRKTGFNHPDLQKLLRLSKENKLRIYISEIAWEEWRTQLLEKPTKNYEALEKAFTEMKARSDHPQLRGLPKPDLSIWSLEEMKAASRKNMEQLARENKIEVVSIAPEHARRAWDGYFNVDPPFNPNEERANRRADIPDSWIFETAKDLHAAKPGLMALCNDQKLRVAMTGIGILGFEDVQEVVAHLDGMLSAAAGVVAVATEATTSKSDDVSAALAEAQAKLQSVDAKVLGYIAYFEPARKDELFDDLSSAGVTADVAKNAADRLAIYGLVQDTGNTYILMRKDLSASARAAVEGEIIELLAVPKK